MTALIDIFSYEIKNSLTPVPPSTTSLKTTQQIKDLCLPYTTVMGDINTWSLRFSPLYTLVNKSYNLNLSLNLLNFLLSASSSSILTSQGILVYQFHQINSSERIFIFTPLSSIGGTYPSQEPNYRTNTSQWGVSISQLFSSARWLEREASELFGIQLLGMVDRRNLLLQYGETSAPLKKSYPSVGWYEIFYLPAYNTLIERSISHTE